MPPPLIMTPAPVTRLARLERCDGCKWHALQADGRGLECREKLEGALVPKDGQLMPISYFKPTMADWWCASWRPRIETAKPS